MSKKLTYNIVAFLTLAITICAQLFIFVALYIILAFGGFKALFSIWGSVLLLILILPIVPTISLAKRGEITEIYTETQKKLLILNILAVVFLVGAWTYAHVSSNISKEKRETQMSSVEGCLTIETMSGQDSCISELARTNLDHATCAQVNGEYMRQYCYEDMYRLIPDKIICPEIEEDFRNSCYLAYAEKQKDSALCKNIPEEMAQSQCVTTVAWQTGDANACRPFTGMVKESCLQSLALKLMDVNLCKEISYPGSDDCIGGVAKNLWDVSVCDLMKDTERAKTCKFVITENSKYRNQ